MSALARIACHPGRLCRTNIKAGRCCDVVRESIVRHSSASSTPGDDSTTNLDDLRRLLESSWNAETMGRVPTSVTGAAEASASALMTALERQDKTDAQSVFFIDILLPQYDITAGTNLYDEVLAVEFCIALANNLLPDGDIEILVRDSKVLQTVSRIFDAREGVRSEIASPKGKSSMSSDSQYFDDFTDLGVDDAKNSSGSSMDTASDTSNGAGTSDVETDSVSSEKTSPNSRSGQSIEDFRDLLLLSWEATGDFESMPPEERIEQDNESVLDSSSISEKRYRLASLLGNATISKGPDMSDDVVRAVSVNALPLENEETIIVLSAITKEELYAVRALVAKYKSSKTIILVNCKLDPIPQEVMRAQTVYSILPLIARKSGANSLTKQKGSGPPKVVVLRRFPRDWEVYVDTGEGFDLADSFPAGTTVRRGPSMDWISAVVKKYLQTRIRL